MSLENTAAQFDSDEEEFVDELKPGTQLMHGQYTIESFLAAGGFGITYLARDSLDRRVVIKECFPGSFCRRTNCSVTPRSRAHQNELKSIVRLFAQEAQSLAKATHPNIVHVHQVFNENNTAYMALDFVNGRDLLEILQEDPDSLRPDLVEGYLVKMLDAIKHIHEMGILHRDISPDNIIISDAGEPILIDFGAARESRNENASRLLSALRVVKDGYSPQEFYITGGEQTPSCDLYSLAASFYHLITGDLPPDSQNRLASCAGGDPDPYVSLGKKTNAYSASFVTALDKAISVMPRDRMQSAEEWLQHLQGTAPKAAPVASAAAPERTGSKMPLILASTAVAALVGAGALYMATNSNDTSTDQQGTATELSSATRPAPTAPAQTAPVDTEEEASQAPLPLETPAGEPAVSDTETAAADPAPEAQSEAPVTFDSIPEVPAPSFQITDGAPSAQPDQIVEAPAPEVAFIPPNARPAARPAPLEESAATITPDLPAVENVLVDMASLLAPETAEAMVDAALPVATAAPELRPIVDVALAGIGSIDAVPVIGLNPTEAQSVRSEADAALQSSVDFFVSMAKPQPELASAPTRRAPQAPAQPRPVAQDDLPAIMAGFGAVPPFTLSPWQAGVIASVSDDGPDWLTPNADIVSINGTPVATNADIVRTLDALASADDASTFEVTLGIEPRLNQPVFERALTIAKERQYLLINGLRFVARENNGVWITEVIDAPTASNFKIGDRLLSYVSTFESIDGPDTLQTILDRELAKGTTSFGFAVSRNGETWVEQLSLAAIAK